MKRTEARELLMKLLFQMEAQNDYSKDAKQTFIENNFGDSEQTEYFNIICDACIDNIPAIDELIESNSKGWKLKRIAKVDLAVMRLCVAEIKFAKFPDVPVGVSINEAVNLAKKYGSEESGKYVNGVLGAISRSL